MNTMLWIIQILLAAVFLTSGSIKLILPKKNLQKVFEWSEAYSQKKLHVIAAFEIAGAFGLFLPGVYPIYEIIIPLAATCLAIVSILAAVTHYNRGEKPELIVNVMIFLLLVVVVVGRLAM